MGIGARLKERRKELRLRVEDVARRAGLRPSTLYDLEREDQHSTTRLHALCQVLGLSPNWVETGAGGRLVTDAHSTETRTEEDTEVMRLHGVCVTRDEVEFAMEWGKLEEPARSLIHQQVMLLVAQQKREAARKRKRQGEPGRETRGGGEH